MWLRRVFASLVMIILLVVSSAASACSIKCAVHRVTPACHTEAADEMASMPGMHHEAVRIAADVEVASAREAGTCGRFLCVEQPALRTAETHPSIHMMAIKTALVVALIRWSQPKGLPTSDGSAVAPLRRSTPVSLYTLLRV